MESQAPTKTYKFYWNHNFQQKVSYRTIDSDKNLIFFNKLTDFSKSLIVFNTSLKKNSISKVNWKSTYFTFYTNDFIQSSQIFLKLVILMKNNKYLLEYLISPKTIEFFLKPMVPLIIIIFCCNLWFHWKLPIILLEPLDQSSVNQSVIKSHLNFSKTIESDQKTANYS